MEKSYKIEGKEIEDEGKLHMIIRFRNVSNMIEFLESNFDEEVGVRSLDALDGGIPSNRKFMLSFRSEGGNRLQIITKETEIV